MTPVFATIDQIARLIIGGIFIYGGSRNLRNIATVQKAILDYLPLPKVTATVLTAAVAPMSFGFGLLLASNTVPNIAAVVLLLLTLVFAVAIGGAITRGLECKYGSRKYSLKTYLVLMCGSVIIMGALAAIATVPRNTTLLQLAGLAFVLFVVVLVFFIQYFALQRNLKKPRCANRHSGRFVT